MFEYMTVQETAEKWDVSLRWVQRLCKTERIDGTMYIGRVGLIPKIWRSPLIEERNRITTKRFLKSTQNEIRVVQF